MKKRVIAPLICICLVTTTLLSCTKTSTSTKSPDLKQPELDSSKTYSGVTTAEGAAKLLKDNLAHIQPDYFFGECYSIIQYDSIKTEYELTDLGAGEFGVSWSVSASGILYTTPLDDFHNKTFYKFDAEYSIPESSYTGELTSFIKKEKQQSVEIPSIDPNSTDIYSPGYTYNGYETDSDASKGAANYILESGRHELSLKGSKYYSYDNTGIDGYYYDSERSEKIENNMVFYTWEMTFASQVFNNSCSYIDKQRYDKSLNNDVISTVIKIRINPDGTCVELSKEYYASEKEYQDEHLKRLIDSLTS